MILGFPIASHRAVLHEGGTISSCLALIISTGRPFKLHAIVIGSTGAISSLILSFRAAERLVHLDIRLGHRVVVKGIDEAAAAEQNRHAADAFLHLAGEAGDEAAQAGAEDADPCRIDFRSIGQPCGRERQSSTVCVTAAMVCGILVESMRSLLPGGRGTVIRHLHEQSGDLVLGQRRRDDPRQFLIAGGDIEHDDGREWAGALWPIELGVDRIILRRRRFDWRGKRDSENFDRAVEQVRTASSSNRSYAR